MTPRPASVDAQGGPMTGNGGGPMSLAKPAANWSHVTGKRHTQYRSAGRSRIRHLSPYHRRPAGTGPRCRKSVEARGTASLRSPCSGRARSVGHQAPRVEAVPSFRADARAVGSSWRNTAVRAAVRRATGTVGAGAGLLEIRSSSTVDLWRDGPRSSFCEGLSVLRTDRPSRKVRGQVRRPVAAASDHVEGNGADELAPRCQSQPAEKAGGSALDRAARDVQLHRDFGVGHARGEKGHEVHILGIELLQTHRRNRREFGGHVVHRTTRRRPASAGTSRCPSGSCCTSRCGSWPGSVGRAQDRPLRSS